MARIRFLRDFQGVNTAGRFFLAGEVADLDSAALVVAEGAAEYVGASDVSSPPAEAPTVQPPVTVDLSNGVDDAEASAAGKALRARRKKKQ